MVRFVSLRGEYAVLVATILAAVSQSCGTPMVGSDAAADVPTVAANQLPPMGRATLLPWLMANSYAGWHCEAMGVPGRTIVGVGSPHGRNRICTNDVLFNAAAAGMGVFPEGSAAVKELQNAAGMIIGYAVERRVNAMAGGAGWYYYEKVPAGTMLPTPNPVEADGTVADGLGNAMGTNAMAVCTGCHSGAPRDNVFVARPGV